MIVVAFSSPLALSPVPRSAIASLRWSGVISFKGKPFRSRGMKCQLSRSSSLNSNRAFACWSGVRASHRPDSAGAISSETFPKSPAGREGASTVIAATAISERPAAAPRLIQRVLNRVVMALAPMALVGTSYKYAGLLPLFRTRRHNRVVSTDVGIEWRTDYDAARKEARDKGRLVLLHFTLAGGPVSQAMEDEALAPAN